VGARPAQRGVVASASYADRAFGVRSAMPTAQVLRLCPQDMVLPSRHKVYRQHSARMMVILSEYSPLIEPLSLDEAFPSTALRDDLRRRRQRLKGLAIRRCWVV
jgi:DNA polymerase-4